MVLTVNVQQNYAKYQSEFHIMSFAYIIQTDVNVWINVDPKDVKTDHTEKPMLLLQVVDFLYLVDKKNHQ